MIEGGTLIREGSKWAVKDGRTFYLDASIRIPSTDFHEAPVEWYQLERNGKIVIKLVVLDPDDNPVTFKAQSSDGGGVGGRQGSHQNTSHQGGQDRNQQSQRDRSKHDERRDQENRERYEKPAFAPYNFVPLNDVVAVSPDKPRTFSGYLEVVITAQTPFFIGNENPPQSDPRNRLAAKPFFQMLGGPLVPGSALRGLTRSMVEMISWSAMAVGLYSDKTLSYRAVAERGGRQRDAYRLVIPANRELTDIKAGYLKYDSQKKEYFIYPATTVDRFPSMEDYRDPEWIGNNCFVRSGKMPPNPVTRKGGKKRQWKLSAASQRHPILVPETVYKVYRDDATRLKRFDVFKAAKAARGDVAKFGYPVFYNTDASGEIVHSIGHTAYYRIPYAMSIAGHVNQVPVTAGDDFAHAIFGTTARAGRVWFEDAHPVPGTIRVLPATLTKPLLGPKPTSFQHYLTQPQGIMTPMDDLRHWGDEDAPIRGHKLYWHRLTPEKGTESWTMERAADAAARGTDQAQIRPLAPGAQFRGRVRFDQLTAEELGALLFALDLPAGMAHKLGFAKPIGLGSVRLSVGLTLLDREKRYGSLLSEAGNWNTGAVPADPERYKRAFTATIAQQLGLTGDAARDLWQTDRLREMAIMLTFNPAEQAKTEWHTATRYMVNGAAQTDKEYRLRPVLPKPSEVVGRFKGSKKN